MRNCHFGRRNALEQRMKEGDQEVGQLEKLEKPIPKPGIDGPEMIQKKDKVMKSMMSMTTRIEY